MAKELTPLQCLMRKARASLRYSNEEEDGHHIEFDKGYIAGIKDGVRAQKKEPIEVQICIWETSGNDACVFVARTKKALYAQVWAVIKDYWDEVVTAHDPKQAKPPKDPVDAIDVYAESCNERELSEYFTFSTETVK